MTSIEKRVHELYWEVDVNCARTMLTCLCELFHIAVEEETMAAAAGLHGAGGYRAQCGLVEGGLMFIGIYYKHIGKSEKDTVSACYHYADQFKQKFGSLSCFDLRPTGFASNDPPHLCEGLTVDAVKYAYEFINAVMCQ